MKSYVPFILLSSPRTIILHIKLMVKTNLRLLVGRNQIPTHPAAQKTGKSLWHLMKSREFFCFSAWLPLG